MNANLQMGENLKDKSAKMKSKPKGVPQNFGYIKKSNGTATANEISTSALMSGSRTAAVSAVPRTNKLKVSGGTQTSANELQQSKTF
jgi:neuron navigator 2